MLASLTVEPAQIAVGILVGVVAFLLAWFLLGSAARQKQDREREARMRAVIQPGQQGGGSSAAGPQSGGWIPTEVTKFGTRFAESRGFSERLDAELEAAGVSLRSGEFVVASAIAALVFGVLGAALLQDMAARAGRCRYRGSFPDDPAAKRSQQARGQASRAAARRSDDHGIVASRRTQFPCSLSIPLPRRSLNLRQLSSNGSSRRYGWGARLRTHLSRSRNAWGARTSNGPSLP